MMDYDIRHGRTYMYFKGEPLYPFGYGLSYTTFKYSNLKTSADSLNKDGAITVSIDVQNSGKIAGDEVVQFTSSISSPRSIGLGKNSRLPPPGHSAGRDQDHKFALPAKSIAGLEPARRPSSSSPTRSKSASVGRPRPTT